MKLIRKITSILVFLLGTGTVVYAANPEMGEKIKKLILGNFSKGKEEEQVKKNFSSENGDILGEEDENGISFQEEVVEEIKALPQKIVTEEVVTQVTEKVNQVIVQTVEETKDLPQKAGETAKEELKKQLYQEICGDWLGEEKEED